MVLALYIALAVLLLMVSYAFYRNRKGHRVAAIQMWEWGDFPLNTRFIRFHPNPGFKLFKSWRWSKFYGWSKT